MVYDIEYGKSLIQRADDYLEDKPVVDVSNQSSQSSKVSFINQNKQKAFQEGLSANKVNRNKDRLAPHQQERYDQLLNQVEENLESILQDKEDYNKGLLMQDG